jgi:hypothetical protein
MESELLFSCVSRLANGQMVYASPAVNDMLNQKGTEFEGKDFFDLVFGQSSTLAPARTDFQHPTSLNYKTSLHP